MAKALDPREHYVRAAVSGVYRDIEFFLHRAFEEAGCSCAPLRHRLEGLDAECTRLLKELQTTHPTFVERDVLHKEIGAIDTAEHPALNQVARTAGPFFRVWFYDQVKAGQPPENFEGHKLAAAYAQAWMDGWRPRLFQEETKGGVK